MTFDFLKNEAWQQFSSEEKEDFLDFAFQEKMKTNPDWQTIPEEEHEDFKNFFKQEAYAQSEELYPLPERTLGGTAKDVLVSGAKGIVGLGGAAVGLMNIPTLGGVGKAMEEYLGYDEALTQQFLSSLYTPRQQEINRRVEEADGFVNAAKAMLKYPSSIGHSLVETMPMMLGGGALGRTLLTTGAKIPAWMAATAGEGLAAGGALSESIRQQTADGLLTLKQAAIPVASGLGTTLFGILGGRVANKFGFGDVDTFLTDAGANVNLTGLTKRLIGGGFTEGVLEELPQTVQETIWENAALDKPLLENVPEGAAKGLIVGAVMGSGFNMVPSSPVDEKIRDDVKANLDKTKREAKEATTERTTPVDITKTESVDEAISTAQQSVNDSLMQKESMDLEDFLTDFERRNITPSSLDIPRPEVETKGYSGGPMGILARQPEVARPKVLTGQEVPILVDEAPIAEPILPTQPMIGESEGLTADLIPPTIEQPGRREMAVPVVEDQRTGIDRRQDFAKRKQIEEMTFDEAKEAIKILRTDRLVDPLTQLGNRQAYDEAPKKPVQGSIDVDSLKFVNDTYGHGAGDALLKAVGAALQETTLDAFHVSGDEYFVQGETEKEIDTNLKQAKDFLSEHKVKLRDPDGNVLAEIKGEFSYGLGETIEEADTKLREEKISRELQGDRAARGKKPPTVTGDVSGRDTDLGKIEPDELAEIESLIQGQIAKIKQVESPGKNERTALSNMNLWLEDLKKEDIDVVEVRKRKEALQKLAQPKVAEKQVVEEKTEEVEEVIGEVPVMPEKAAEEDAPEKPKVKLKAPKKEAKPKLEEPPKAEKKPKTEKTKSKLTPPPKEKKEPTEKPKAQSKLSAEMVQLVNSIGKVERLKSIRNKAKGDPELVAAVDKRIAEIEKKAEKSKEEKPDQTKETPSFRASDQAPGQGLTVKDIQKAFPGQKVFMSPDGKIAIRFNNGFGMTIENVKEISAEDIQLAISMGLMSENGIVLGKTDGVEVTLNENYADMETLFHETVHVLKNLGVLTAKDEKALMLELNKLEQAGKFRYARSTHKDKDKAREEDLANVLAQIRADRITESDTTLGKIMQKIMDFIDGLLHVGRMSSRKLAREFETGKIYRRLPNGQTVQTSPSFEQMAPMWYSALAGGIISSKQAKAPASQWKAMIKKMPGIKEEELDWIGLNEWLDGQTGSITKDQILDFVQSNVVRLEEVLKTSESFIRNLSDIDFDIEFDSMFDTDWRNDFDTREAAEEHYLANVPDDIVGETRHSRWQEPGGEDYKELLLTIPAKKETAEETFKNLVINTRNEIKKTEEYKNDPGILNPILDSLIGFSAFDNFVSSLSDYYTKEKATKIATKIMDKTEKTVPLFYNRDHFEEPNILTHVRFNTRYDEAGNRILFLEEIQSDWHQAGRREGYQGELKKPELTDLDYPEVIEKIEKLEDQYNETGDEKYFDEANSVGIAYKNDLNNKLVLSGLKDFKYMRDVDGWVIIDPDGVTAAKGKNPQETYDKLVIGQNALGATKSLGVPDAPFKSTKAWTMLAMKRMVRYAAEHGFDKIAWTTGEMQVERYKEALQSNVDKIEWTKTPEGVHLIGYKDENLVVDTKEEENALSDVIGKTMADQIISDKNQTGIIEGEDITISDKGMARFYDKMLPNNLKKTFKKMDGRIEVIELPKIGPVLAMPITDKMKSTALRQGMPMFQTSDRVFDIPDVSTLLDSAEYNIIDQLSPFKKVYKAIKDEIPEDQDFVLKERLRLNRSVDAIGNAELEWFNPMKEVMAKYDYMSEDVDEALYTRHAPEANVRLKRVNAKRFLEDLAEAQKDGSKLREKIAEITKKFKEADISKAEVQDDYLDLLETELEKAKTPAEVAVKNEWNRSKDIFSGMTTEKAEKVYDKKYRNDPGMQKILGIYDKMIQESLDISLESGRISQAEYDALAGTYEFYAPLYREGFAPKKGFEDTGYGIVNLRKDYKIRGGSTRPAVNMLGNAMIQHEQAIIRAEKARAARAFIKLVQNNPLPSFWRIKQKQLVNAYDTHGNIVKREDTKIAPNEIPLKVDGKYYVIEMMADNTHALRIADVLKGNNVQTGPIVNGLARINRFLSMVNTSLNPEFIFLNFARDLQIAAVNLESTEANKMKMQVLKDVPKAIAGLHDYLRGKGDSKWAKEAKELAERGGMMDWVDQTKDVESRVKKLNRDVKLYQGKNVPLKATKNLFQVIQDYNTIAENAVRLAAFVSAKEIMSADKATLLSKELTVNFTQSGVYGQLINSLYLFSKAGILGSARFISGLMKSKKAQKMMAGMVVTSAGMAIANSLMGGTDDDGENYYSQIRESDKERNIIIMHSSLEGKPIKIPLGWGLNFFWFLGTEIGDAFLAGKDYKPIEGASRVINVAMNTFNPLHSATLAQTLTPTILDPVVQVKENKTFFGTPLMPEKNSFERIQTPDSERYWKSVSPVSKEIARLANQLGGGDKIKKGAEVLDISPETLDLVFDTVTGGAGRFTTGLFSAPMKLINGEEISFGDLPVARKFLGKPDEYLVQREYYDNLEHVYMLNEQIKEYPDRRAALKKDKTYRMLRDAKSVEKRIRRLKKMKKMARTEAAKTRIDKQIKDLQDRFNDKFYKRSN